MSACFGLLATSSGENGFAGLWYRWRSLDRFVLAATVAAWWVAWDLGAGREMTAALQGRFLNLGSTSAQPFLFWLLPVLSLNVFLLICYSVARKLEKQRWSFAALVWRAWWGVASFVIPLLMAACGFDLVFQGRIIGIFWLMAAGVVYRIGTGVSRIANGMKMNLLKSGELRNRVLRMAEQMGVKIRHVFVVPAGKGHLTNAYAASDMVAVTDSLRQHLTKVQMDYSIAHELAHAKRRHSRKTSRAVLVIYLVLVVSSFGIAHHAVTLQPVARVFVTLGPLLFLYYLSRRFEYAADHEAVDFTGEPEVAIKALRKLHRFQETLDWFDGFSELFHTHPPFLKRARAIARMGRISEERLSEIMEEF